MDMRHGTSDNEGCLAPLNRQMRIHDLFECGKTPDLFAHPVHPWLSRHHPFVWPPWPNAKPIGSRDEGGVTRLARRHRRPKFVCALDCIANSLKGAGLGTPANTLETSVGLLDRPLPRTVTFHWARGQPIVPPSGPLRLLTNACAVQIRCLKVGRPSVVASSSNTFQGDTPEEMEHQHGRQCGGPVDICKDDTYGAMVQAWRARFPLIPAHIACQMPKRRDSFITLKHTSEDLGLNALESTQRQMRHTTGSVLTIARAFQTTRHVRTDNSGE